jgi:hypothetical protein
MHLNVAIPLTLLAQAASSSAIPNTAVALDTRASNNVEKRDTKVINILFDTTPLLGLIKNQWLFFETTQGHNAGCAARTKEAGQIKVEESYPDVTKSAALPEWPNGTYTLADLFKDGKKGKDACQYMNDNNVRISAVHFTIVRHGKPVLMHGISAIPRYLLIAERYIHADLSPRRAERRCHLVQGRRGYVQARQLQPRGCR